VVGAVSADECVSPLFNFIISFLCVAMVLWMLWKYVVRGEFYKLAFMRREKFVAPTIKSCQTTGALLSDQMLAMDEKRQEEVQWSASTKTVLLS